MGEENDDFPESDQRMAVVKKIRRVFDGFLKVDEALVAHPRYDGGFQTVTRQSMERGDSVAVLLVDRQKKTVWLVEQFRYPVMAKTDGWIEELPAGMPQPAEEADAAALREVAEETGFTGLTLEHVSTFYVSPGGTSERIILYCAFVDGLTPDLDVMEQRRDEQEDIRLIEEDLDDFLLRARMGEINDAKTLIGGLWLIANQERLGLSAA